MQTFNFPRPGALLACCAMLLLAIACKDDDSNTSNNNQHVNDWILENMQAWYLWNDELPAETNKNLAPSDYFNSLLYDGDRFSWIQDNYQELLNSLQGVSKEAGYEFALYLDRDNESAVIAQILYVKPDSPAEKAGLKRGDVVTRINNTQITISNYQTLLSALDENHTLTYRALDLQVQQLEDDFTTISLITQEYHENPNYFHSVIETGDHKIGYYVYNFFASGAGSGNEYDTEMESIINNFKTAGVTDLVLDLRFNSGGSEVSALALASLLGASVDNTKVFMRKEYNDEIEQEILNDPELGADILTVNFTNKAANMGTQLQNNRLYILTSSRTASASELIINGLRPYMNVLLVGDTTYGKNVGSVSLYDDNDASNKWGMQPIVVKVYNSQGQSDYDGGFFPNIIDPDNNLLLYPLGDTREALLAKAIGHITGEGTIGRTGVIDRPLIAHSLDRKKRSFQLTVDDRVLRTLTKQ